MIVIFFRSVSSCNGILIRSLQWIAGKRTILIVNTDYTWCGDNAHNDATTGSSSVVSDITIMPLAVKNTTTGLQPRIDLVIEIDFTVIAIGKVVSNYTILIHNVTRYV